MSDRARDRKRKPQTAGREIEPAPSRAFPLSRFEKYLFWMLFYSTRILFCNKPYTDWTWQIFFLDLDIFVTSLLRTRLKSQKTLGPAKVQKKQVLLASSKVFFFRLLFLSLSFVIETRRVLCRARRPPPVVVVLQQRGMGKRKRPWLNETHLKNEEERRRVKQKERAERNRRFREKRRREEKDETQWTAPGEDARDGKGEEWERDKEGGKDEEAYDEFEARKELMQQMNLTRPPGKKKSALKQQQFNYQTNNTFTTEGEEGERKMGDNDDEDEEKEMYDEDEKDISAALLPQSPLLLSSSNGKALGNSKSIERARNDATSNIQHFARVKQLSKATQTFRNLVKNQRVNPSVYTYCALLNAYANAGRTKDIEIILRRMVTETKYKEAEAEAEAEAEEEEEEEEEEKGKEDAIIRPDCKPNVVAFTMLLKSYLIECDARSAVKLIESMASTSKVSSEDGDNDISQCARGVGIDSRALNTFYRVCLRTGDVSSAIQWTGTKVDDVLDGTSKLLLAKMYAQSFRQDLLKQEIDSMQTSIDDCLNGRGVKDGLKNGVKERQAPTCLFWKNGECQRGKMCKFYHDPNVKQKVPERREMAQKYDCLSQMYGCLARLEANIALTLATDKKKKKSIKACLKAIKSCEKACKQAREANEGSVQGEEVETVEEDELELADPHRRNLFRNTNRLELERDMVRLKDIVSKEDGDSSSSSSSKDTTTTIDDCFSRCLLFTSKLGNVLLDDVTNTNINNRENSSSTSELLFQELENSLGLNEVFVKEDDKKKRTEKLRKRLKKTIDSKTGHINFKKLFHDVHKKAKEENEICLEVAAGNGEWALAQAAASSSSSSKNNKNKVWIASELRRDRSCDIFNRICVSKLQNIAVVSGDAFRLLRESIPPNSLHQIFINFPEPPHHSGDEKSRNDKALLNKEFFVAAHMALKKKDKNGDGGGGLTIYSDNERYMHTLAKMISGLTVDDDEIAFESEKSYGADELSDTIEASFENVQGVRLYTGSAPGKGSGFETYEESFFDRFWQAGSRIERYFMVFSKR